MDKDTQFTEVKVIEYFDGDLLTHLTHNGKHYLKKFCDVIDQNSLPWTYIYTITETSPELIEDYINGTLDMKTLLYAKPKAWLMTEKDVVLSLIEITTADIPSKYGPEDDVYYDVSLSPE